MSTDSKPTSVRDAAHSHPITQEYEDRIVRQALQREELHMSSTAVQVATCPYCGSVAHPGGVGTCPQVMEIEYYPDGTIKRVKKL